MAFSAPADGSPCVPELLQAIASHVTRQPAAPAIDSSGGRLDYAALWAASSRLADALSASGVQPGELVLSALGRGPSIGIAVLALWRCGAVYVPIDPDAAPAERFRAIAEDAGARFVLVDGGWPGGWDMPGLAAIDVREPSTATSDREAPAPLSDPIDGDLPAYMIYTSGSTGTPKGVVIGHRGLAAIVASMGRELDLPEGPRTLAACSPAFDMGLAEWLVALAHGGCACVAGPRDVVDGQRLATRLREARVDLAFATPSQWRLLLDASGGLPEGLRAVAGAEALTPALAARMLEAGLRVWNMYGPTETTMAITSARVLDASAPITVGHAFPGTAVRVVDAQGLDCEAGVPGEVWIGGVSVAWGYHRRESLTRDRFLRDARGRWYRSGDLGFIDPDGALQLIGRIDDQLKLRGHRIEPGEIEAQLEALPGVRGAAVVALEAASGERELRAAVVADTGVDPASLRAALAARLPSWMLPARIMLVERLPLTGNGKIDRGALARQWTDAVGAPPHAPPAAGTGGDHAARVERLLDWWQGVTGGERLDPDRSVFDQGATSLLVSRWAAAATAAGADLGAGDVYDHPAVRDLARHWATRGAAPASTLPSPGVDPAAAIAVIGAAVRAPEAVDLEAFWTLLTETRVATRRWSASELDPLVPAASRASPAFVPVRGAIDGETSFDAPFFGIGPREAPLIDPQQRLLLELSWHALEHAGLAPSTVSAAGGRIGVFAGTAPNPYERLLREHAPEAVARAGDFQVALGNDKDYVATRIAWALDLKGPAVSVHTACSTGLTCVAQAVESLRAGRCDVALAGACTLLLPQRAGYLAVEGGIDSPSGRCRPFDAEADGTVFSSGAGVVVLKRLDQAIADGDRIMAIVRGIGVSNDGGHKASFTAPSAEGQEAALRAAVRDAGIDPLSVGAIEAHGTGTPVGDPIEVAALASVYGRGRTTPCILGSSKANIGHTIAAAGLLGFVKAALSLDRGALPGTPGFGSAHPALRLEDRCFAVSAATRPWPRGAGPRRIAVSALGVGGTNVHVVLEEGPERGEPATPAPAGPVLLPFSARSSEALPDVVDAWRSRLDGRPIATIRDALVAEREAMPFRAVLTLEAGEEPHERLAALAARLRQRPASAVPKAPRRVVALLPGQGAQFPGMARDAAARHPAFAAALDEALEALAPHAHPELRRWLLDPAADPAQLAETRHAQPALFAFGYASGRWLAAEGVAPSALIGHSIGEWTAACLAGALSLEAAARAVCERAEAMWAQPRGAMLAVRADEARVRERLPAGVAVAAINGPDRVVVAGRPEDIAAAAARFAEAGIAASELRVSHAFHGPDMAGAVTLLRDRWAARSWGEPRVPVYSCVTGAPLAPEDSRSADYWLRQLREPVRFADAIAHAATPGTVFVDLGPGRGLPSLVRAIAGDGADVVALHAGPDARCPTATLEGLGELWRLGVPIAWPATGRPAFAGPAYPFRRLRCWFREAESTPPVATPPTSAVTPPTLETPMAPSPVPADVLAAELARLLAPLAGLRAEDMAIDQPFVDLGFDSLTLTQAALEIGTAYGIKMRFRRLMEDLDTLSRLAGWLAPQLPPRMAPAPSTPPAAVDLAPASTPAAAVMVHAAVPAAIAAPNHAPADALVALLSQQMSLMQQTLALIAHGGPSAPVTPPPTSPAIAPAAPVAAPAAAIATEEAAADLRERPFGASARITLKGAASLDAPQRAWLADFTSRYVARTGRSKAFAQANRARMADPRVVTGFHPLWKELVYPIVVESSRGAELVDLDGNRYIDVLSSFGANLLGHQPEAVARALHEQIDRGFEVGPQHPLAADVCDLLAELTGHPRVALCNTGSEAVMGAMRVARTVTGRKTIAIFAGSYHGIFDEVVVRGTPQLRSLSAAPGILASAVENILVLEWGSDEALKVLAARGHELAAVMVEPVQNRNPDVLPKAFVEALRRLCDDSGAALIFDEVVTGFRVAPGGAQALYGVRADLCTYGKAMGGGMIIAAIAGQGPWMDAFDGGAWRFGDDSYPEAGVTYFAGTFVRHPLALAAAKAALLEIKARGPALHADLERRTSRLVSRLNAHFEQVDAPVRAIHCGSMWRLRWDEAAGHVALFYYLCRHHGLHLYEQFGHFVTAAMDDRTIERIGDAFIASLDELLDQGLLQPRGGGPRRPHPIPPSTTDRESAALGPGQRDRWMAAQYDPAALVALNESLVVHLEGTLDAAAMVQAFSDVAAHHPAFRIAIDPGRPIQREVPGAMPVLVLRDLSAEGDPEAALDAAIAESGARRFALGTAPMVAATLYRIAADRHALHLVGSHLVLDGWSSPIVLGDLAEAYRARRAGRPPTLAPSCHPFDATHRLQAAFDGPQGLEDGAWWAATLRDAPPPILLGDRPPGRRQFLAGSRRRVYAPSTLRRLHELAKRGKATLVQVLLAEVALLLREHAGRDDLVIGLPTAGQAAIGAPRVANDAVIDLPLRLRLGTATTVEDALPIAKAALLDALEHPLASQGDIARAIGRTSLGDRAPFAEVYLTLNPRIDLSGFAPLAANLREGPKPGCLGAILFNFHECDDDLRLELHFSRDHFSDGRVDALLDALDARLAGRVAAPRPSARALADASRGAGQREALRFNGESRDYAWLDRRVRAIGSALVEAGVRRGDRVGIVVRRGLDLVPALLGTWEAAAAYVPLDTALPAARLRHMADESNVRVLLCDDPARIPAELLDGRRVVPLGEVREAAAGWRRPDLDGGDPAYVLFTSGSTGKPKGVVVLQANVAAFLEAMAERPGIGPDDRVLAVTTASFDIAVLELLLPATVGACVAVADEEELRDPTRFWPRFLAERPTLLQTTPTVAQLWLGAGSPEALSGTTLLLGGEALPRALATQLLPHVRALWNMYGPTETTVWSTCGRVVDPLAPIDVGTAIRGTTVVLLDADGRPTDVGPAEIGIGGEGVAAGYVGRPELTAERFIAIPGVGRVYRTGDLGEWLPDRRLRHLGRLDAQVKLRGHRIEPGEIEALIAEVPGIDGAGVAVVDAEGPDARLVAGIVARNGMPDDTLLRRHLAEHLPGYMLPRLFVPLEALPLTPSGKLDRRALADRLGAMPPPPAPALASTREAADMPPDVEAVARAMATALGLTAMDADTDFFQVGGHSLLAITVAAHLSESEGAAVAMRDLFDHPTPRRLAARLQALRGQGPAAIPRAADQSVGPASVLQKRLLQLQELSGGNARYHLPSGHRLRGPFDVERFEAAIRAMIARQPILRTRLVREADRDVQRVEASVDWRMPPIVDLSGLRDDAAKIAAVRAEAKSLIDQPIPMDRAPMVRTLLFRLAPDDHLFVWIPHQAIWDGWSFDLFYAEMAALYGDPAAAAARPPLATSYIDYAAWQATYLASSGHAKDIGYWRERFSRGGPWPALEGDVPREGRRHETRNLQHRFPRSLVDRLHATARSRATTLFTLVFAAVAASLQTMTGRDELLIGTPVRGREMPGLDSLMGYFVGLLPIPVSLEPGMALGAIAERIGQETRGAFAHAGLQLEELLALRKDSRAGTPLYQASISFQDVRARPRHWGALDHERVSIGAAGVNEDLAIGLIEAHDGLGLDLRWNGGAFSEAWIGRFVSLLGAGLDALADDPGRPLPEPAPAPQAPTPVSAPATPATAPRVGASSASATERDTIRRLWGELLGRDDLEDGDNFFDLGGHSLMALAFVQKLEAETGVRIALLKVANRSLGALADEVRRERHATDGDAPSSRSGKGGVFDWLSRTFRRRGH